MLRHQPVFFHFYNNKNKIIISRRLLDLEIEKNVGDVFGSVSTYTNPILTSKPF